MRASTFLLVCVLMLAAYIVLVEAPKPVSRPINVEDPYSNIADINAITSEMNSTAVEHKGKGR